MEDDRSRRHELAGETNGPPVGLTLGGILSIKQTSPYRIQERTLLDLIRDDPTCGKESKKTWKMFKDKLRLKLAGAAWSSTVSDVRINTNSNLMTTRNGSNIAGESTLQLSSPPATIQDTQTELQEESEDNSLEEDRGGAGDGGRSPAARMSLMSLLEVEGSVYLDDGDEEEEEAAVPVPEPEEGGGVGGYNNCCVCMVRHKGAAFIPCGHTFCRLCSRELFVQRANCPLCNNFILEILDIF